MTQIITETEQSQSSKENSREQGTFLVFEELQQAFKFLWAPERNNNSSSSLAICMNNDFCANSPPEFVLE